MAYTAGYQGKNGTFSEIAVLNYFKGQEIEQRNYKDFESILKDCDAGILDYALLPVENTTTGLIWRTYDLFGAHKVQAVGEVIVPIREDLVVVPGTKIEEIKEVYSHPEALSQCLRFFAEHPDCKSCTYQDTASSVEYIKNCNDKSKAALASSRAAEYYGMTSLLTSVQDSNANMTRFLCVSAVHPIPEDANKVSIMITLNHEPGSLYHALGILSYADINVLKLESRPIPQEPFHYRFYIDFQGHPDNPFVKTALMKLREHSLELRVLGAYKAAEI